MNKDEMIKETINKDLIDLLVDFDEMGFCPTTLTADPDEYAKEWKQKLVCAIEEQLKETAREILQDLKAKCKELENKFSHLCKSKKECLMETFRYEGVLAVKRELYELAKEVGIELE